MMALFEEKQFMPRFVIAAMLAGVAMFGAVVIALQVTGGAPPERMRTLWIVLAAMAAANAATVSIRMATEVRPDGITVYCVPLVFVRRQIGWDAIGRMYARAYSPIAEYGGWGIKKGKSGTAYNMRGRLGIQLELTNGKRVLIGTQRPEAFLEAVRSAGGPAVCVDQ